MSQQLGFLNLAVSDHSCTAGSRARKPIGAVQLFQKSGPFLYLGCGVHYAIAREGALKLNEISYVQPSGLPAGELRRGPDALVDENRLVVVLATKDASDPNSMLRFQKTLNE